MRSAVFFVALVALFHDSVSAPSKLSARKELTTKNENDLKSLQLKCYGGLPIDSIVQISNSFGFNSNCCGSPPPNYMPNCFGFDDCSCDGGYAYAISNVYGCMSDIRLMADKELKANVAQKIVRVILTLGLYVSFSQ